MKKITEQNIFKRIIHFLSHPAWNGAAFFLAAIVALAGVSGVVLASIFVLFSRVQNLILWLLEPLNIPRYLIVSGLIVLLAFAATSIWQYIVSRGKFSLLSKGNRFAENKSKFLPIPLPPGTGNAYLKDRYLDPPSRIVLPNGIEFELKPNSLILDTNETIRYIFPKDDGSIEFGFQLPKLVQNIKAVYFLINSGNSKSIYNSFKMGKIKLIFKDAPPINTELVLGQNIREWCVGNSGT